MMKNKLNIWLMYAIALFQGMVFYGPIATLYRQAQGVSLFQITIIESISLALLIFLEIPWGYVADRIGYKKTLLICNVLYFISKIVFWKATGFAWFLAERLILSVVISGLSGCDSALLFASAGKNDSHKVFGIYAAMGTAGLVIASLTYSIAIVGNYPLSGFLTVISYGVSLLFTLFLKEIKPDLIEGRTFAKNIKSVLLSFRRDKRFLLFLTAAFLLTESNQTITVFLSQVQYIKTGMPQSYIGYIYIIMTVSGLLSAFSSRFTESLGEEKASKVLFLSAAAACGVISFTASPIISVLCIILLRISSSVFTPISMKIQNRQVKVSDRATMLSVYSNIMNGGAVFTNLIFGGLADINISFGLGAGAVFCFMGLVLYAIWAKGEGCKA